MTSKETKQLSAICTHIVDRCPVAMFVLNLSHEITHWNRACEELTGHSAASMVGTTRQWAPFSPTERPVLADLILTGAPYTTTFYNRIQKLDSTSEGLQAEDFFPDMGIRGKWLLFAAVPLINEMGQMCGAVQTLHDISEQKWLEDALQESHNGLAQTVDGSSIPTFVIGRDHRVTHWNRACQTLTGVPANAVLGTDEQWRPFYNAPRPLLADLVLYEAQTQVIEIFYPGKCRPSALVKGALEAEDFFPSLGENGRWLFFTAAPIRNQSGETVSCIETVQDISGRKNTEIALRKSEERYRLISQLDGLTQLFNSRHLHEQLAREFERFIRYKRPLSLLMMDADYFKRINDTYGHVHGDFVLQELARIMRQTLRNTDMGFRYGGEEFAALLPETKLDTALMLAERLRTSVETLSFDLGGADAVRCTVSIGVAEMTEGESAQLLLQRADRALYQAKALGRNRVERG